jgi:hypothetical protein
MARSLIYIAFHSELSSLIKLRMRLRSQRPPGCQPFIEELSTNHGKDCLQTFRHHFSNCGSLRILCSTLAWSPFNATTQPGSSRIRRRGSLLWFRGFAFGGERVLSPLWNCLPRPGNPRALCFRRSRDGQNVARWPPGAGEDGPLYSRSSWRDFPGRRAVHKEIALTPKLERAQSFRLQGQAR